MSTLVFLLEEESMKAYLEQLLPRVLPESVHFRIFAFEGKSDLEKNIPAKLRGWRLPDSRFVIIRDQDSGDCLSIKAKLKALCEESGKGNISLVRIACKELESWHLGNLSAVETALGIDGLAKLQNKAKYRNPDLLTNASDELKKITGGKYQKVNSSRKLGGIVDISANCSTSFQQLISGIQKVLSVAA